MFLSIYSVFIFAIFLLSSKLIHESSASSTGDILIFVSPTISIPNSFSISIFILFPSSLADIQVGCFKLLIIMSLFMIFFSFNVSSSSSLYSIVWVITVVFVSLSYAYQIFTSYEPVIFILFLSSSPLKL